ncbi:MAG TPA: hypothetical protein VH008_33620 [Pseudonocardia sp.]|nr:hypothetical protein [Pseudonocardia sp.]
MFSGLEEQVVCHDCRPGPLTEQLDPVQAELSHAPTELLNPIRPEEHLAGPRITGSLPLAVVAEPGPAPVEAPPMAAPEPDPGPTEVLSFEVPPEPPPVEAPTRPGPDPFDAADSDLLRTDPDLPRIDAPRADSPPADSPSADSPRGGSSGADASGAGSPPAQTRRARAAAARTPHRRALQRPGVPARGRLKDDVQGPLIILAVLCAIVAIVGGIKHNSFLGLGGGLLSGAAIVAIIIIGLTSSK